MKLLSKEASGVTPKYPQLLHLNHLAHKHPPPTIRPDSRLGTSNRFKKQKLINKLPRLVAAVYLINIHQGRAYILRQAPILETWENQAGVTV